MPTVAQLDRLQVNNDDRCDGVCSEERFRGPLNAADPAAISAVRVHGSLHLLGVVVAHLSTAGAITAEEGRKTYPHVRHETAGDFPLKYAIMLKALPPKPRVEVSLIQVTVAYPKVAQVRLADLVSDPESPILIVPGRRLNA